MGLARPSSYVLIISSISEHKSQRIFFSSNNIVILWSLVEFLSQLNKIHRTKVNGERRIMYRQGKCHLCKAEGFFFSKQVLDGDPKPCWTSTLHSVFCCPSRCMCWYASYLLCLCPCALVNANSIRKADILARQLCQFHDESGGEHYKHHDMPVTATSRPLCSGIWGERSQQWPPVAQQCSRANDDATHTIIW